MGRVGVGAAVARVRGSRVVVRAVAALGASESGLARLWDEGMTGRASSGDADAVRLEVELGYGFREGSRMMTPRAGFGYEEGGARLWRLGTRFAFRPGLAPDVEAERKEGSGDDERGVRLELRVRW